MSSTINCAICVADRVAVAVPAEADNVATMVKDAEAVAVYDKIAVLVAAEVPITVRKFCKMVPPMFVSRNLADSTAATEPVTTGST